MSFVPVKVATIAFLLCCSAFFSCSETVFFSLSRVEIKRFRESKNSFMRRVTKVLKRPREILITILLGNEVINVAIAVLFASLVYDVIGDVGWEKSTLISVLIATPVIMMFGEVIPKNIAIHLAGTLAPVIAVPIRLFYWIMTPLRVGLTALADAFVKLFGGDPEKVRPMIMEEEVRQIVDIGCEEGALAKPEGELIHAVLDFSDKTARHVMTPLECVFKLPLNIPFEKLIEEIRKTRFSRIPVYQENPEDIVGLLYVRDFISFYKELEAGRARDLEEIIRSTFFVEETMRLEELLHEFKERKIHMAIVVDEKRKASGIVTMDDVLSAIFGREGT